jgi:NAD(P)H-flavin reductase
VLRLGSPVGGRLTLTHRTSGDVVLIAGGTGLSPLRALIDQLVQEENGGVGGVGAAGVAAGRAVAPDPVRPRQVQLFLGGQVESDLYDLANLQRLAAEHRWLSVVPVLSGDLSYAGERGLVADAALRHGPWVDPQIYVCGSPAMVEGSVERLVGAGILQSTIHVEDFGGYSLSTMGEGGRT